MANIEKVVKARQMQKHDIEANWIKAVNFIPKDGEFIVYDEDENHTTPRVKIGNGKQTVNQLPFIDEEILNKFNEFSPIGVTEEEEGHIIFEGVYYGNASNNITAQDLTIDIDDTGNVFDKTKVKVGYEIYHDGTTRAQAQSAISDFIYVKGHPVLYINNLPIYSGINRYSHFYDANKKPIYSSTQIKAAEQATEIIIPEGAYYFAFSIYQRYASGSKDYETTTVSFTKLQEYVPPLECIKQIKGYGLYSKNANEIELPTHNKKMLIFGDSITESASMNNDGTGYVEGTRPSWVKHATTYLQTKNFKNYAKTGATYKDANSTQYRQNVSEQITLAMADSNNDDAEIIVISLGVNDGATSLGNYDTAMSKATLSELDKTNLYEALRWTMWTLQEKYANALFFVGLPIQTAAKEQPEELLNAIKKMANRYNFIVIDATNESGIVRDFEISGANGRYLEDGLHPNEAGNIKLAKLYSNVIMRYFLIN